MCFFTSENNPRTSWSNPRSESRKSDSRGLKKTVCWLEDHNRRLQKDALQAPIAFSSCLSYSFKNISSTFSKCIERQIRYII